MNWFKKLIPARIRVEGVSKRNIPEGIWVNCKNCGAMLYKPELERCQFVCNKCDHHMRIGARHRLSYFLDPDSTSELIAAAFASSFFLIPNPIPIGIFTAPFAASIFSEISFI